MSNPFVLENGFFRAIKKDNLNIVYTIMQIMGVTIKKFIFSSLFENIKNSPYGTNAKTKQIMLIIKERLCRKLSIILTLVGFDLLSEIALYKSSIVTPNISARGSINSVEGYDTPFSHFDTALFVTPSFSPSSL